MERLVKAMAERIEKDLEVNVIVSIECAEIHLQNCHSLEIKGIEETDNTIELVTDILTFTVGKNYTESSFDDCENEYTFEYANGVVITIAII